MKNNLQNIQQDHSREDRFKRIAANRTNEVLDRIRILGTVSYTHLTLPTSDLV